MVQSNASQLRAQIETSRVLPQDIYLSNVQPTQIVLLHEVDSSGMILNGVQADIVWTCEPAGLVEVTREKDGPFVARAKQSGAAKLTARWQGTDGSAKHATASVRAIDIERDPIWEFTNHVESILSRNGCNSGGCHGAKSGKGGFRLSLRGYDPATDHFNMTRIDRGRRVELAEPALSLVIAKPSGLIEHKGGLRLPPDSQDYRVMIDWIVHGAAATANNDPKLVRVEIQPESIQLARNNKQPLFVRAHFSNGRSEDVTRWSKFSSSDESIAVVNENGEVQVVGPGEGAVTAWYASRVVSSRIRVPFHESKTSAESASIRSKLDVSNFIDKHVADQLVYLGIEPSDAIDDATFARRSALDATGKLPTAEEVQAFLNDPSPEKRSRWIDSLLASPQYVDYWAYRWSDVLMLNSNLLPTDGVRAYYQWIHQQVERNTPWNELVQQILTARGEALENGATNFYTINQDPESMSENACQAFMGLSIGCAKCHNHPLEKWTNDQYYAMANLFARVRAKGWGGDVRNGEAARTVYVLDRGDLIQPSKGKPQPPAPLDGEPIDIDSTADRREVLADWMTSPKNPYFTRAIVNRVWAAYFGVGIVNAVDDLRASNPDTNPALMAALCEDLAEHRYDLKHLMRRIMNSSTYQRQSEPNASNKDDRKYFSRYFPRRLPAEVIHDAISDVAQVPTEFNKVSFLGGDKRDTKFYPKGTRAIQLFDSSVDSDFLRTFGRNQRRITCECERSDEPSVIQALNLSNGDLLNQKLAAPNNIIDQWITSFGDDHEALVRTAYLRCLSRNPNEAESKRFREELSNAGSENRIVVEDLLWSLVTSREFLFAH